MSKNNFGIVFDIDGVILRGKNPIPCAVDAIQKVQDAHIPYVFMTNNGMETEEGRAQRLGNTLNMEIPGDKMVLCHSALKEEAAAFGDGLVLVTGFTKTNIIDLMKGLGFRNVRTTEEYAACQTDLVPNKTYPPQQDRSWADEAVKAVVLLEMPTDWERDLQVICDLLRSDGRVGHLAENGSQPVKFIVCNFDFTFVGAHSWPRFGPGAFVDLLDHLYSKMTNGRHIEIIKHGKPHPPTYNCAKKILQTQASKEVIQTDHSPVVALDTVYAIGDNPKSDVRGANAMGDGWKSVLVKTGCFQPMNGQKNDPEDPADFVVDDVLAGINLIVELEANKGSEL